ncbi:hypothetical protein BDV32DRAFT_125875 [Aspergillus pseudonomiae]|nr:hypothetical protein BDV32DRAFT_125875 [Aspergillus pseudonomiae]
MLAVASLSLSVSPFWLHPAPLHILLGYLNAGMISVLQLSSPINYPQRDIHRTGARSSGCQSQSQCAGILLFLFPT